MDVLLTHYCRICAVPKSEPHNELLNFDSDSEKWRELTEKLTRINANIDTNILTKNVCLGCIVSLEEAYKFVIAVERAQATFNQLIANVKQEETTVAVEVDKAEIAVERAEATFNQLIPNVKQEETTVAVEVDEAEIIVDIKQEHLESEEYNIIYEPPDFLSDDINESKHDIAASLIQGHPDFTSDDKTKAEVNDNPEITIEVPPEKCKKTKTIKKRISCWITYGLEDLIPLSKLKCTWKDFNWVCWVCETEFPTVGELQEHSISYHNRCNSYKCLDCPATNIYIDNFIDHIHSHKEHLKLSCYKCLKPFESLEEADNHKNIHQTSKFICKGCNVSFPSHKELTEHTTMYFAKHRGKYGVGQRDACPICEVCGQSFSNEYGLAYHRKSHDDDRPFRCKICGMRFKVRSSLRSHLGVHDGRKLFKCDKCGKRFRQHKQLKKHSIVHTDLMPFVCSYCNKSFRFWNNLKSHMLQHTGDRPYSCSECDHKFTNSGNYNKHMKIKHGKNTVKEKPVIIKFN